MQRQMGETQPDVLCSESHNDGPTHLQRRHSRKKRDWEWDGSWIEPALERIKTACPLRPLFLYGDGWE